MSGNLTSLKHSRRQFLKVSAGAIGTLALAACAAPVAVPAEGETGEAAGQEPITIKMLLTPGGIQQYMGELTPMYTEMNPHVTFEITIIEQEQKRATEFTIMTNPGAPDVAWINFGSGLTDRLAEADAIVPLTEYYEQYGWWDFLPDHLHTHEYNGHMYHFSVASVTTPLMWYNTQLMSDMGLEPPTNMEELYAWAETIRANDLQPLAMGDRDGWPGFHMYQCIASRTNPLEDYEKILNFDEEEYYMADYPGFQEAFQIMRDMETNGVWANGVLDMNDADARALLLTGEAVAYETGTWNIANMREGLGENLDFFLFPQIEPDIPPPMTASYADEFMLSKFSDQAVQDEVADFFDFVLSKEGQKVIAKLGTMPIRIDMTAEEIGEVGDPLSGKVVEMMGSGDYPITDEIVTFWPAELYALLRQNGQAAIGGQKTPAEIVEEFDELAAKFRAGTA